MTWGMGATERLLRDDDLVAELRRAAGIGLSVTLGSRPRIEKGVAWVAVRKGRRVFHGEAPHDGTLEGYAPALQAAIDRYLAVTAKEDDDRRFCERATDPAA